MTITALAIEDKEVDKFVESPTRSGKTAIEVFSMPASFSIPPTAKVYTYRLGTTGGYYTEVYKFYESGTPIAPVNLLKTICIYYSDAARKNEIGGLTS